jgi:uncharacterized protein (TIGR02246 family)
LLLLAVSAAAPAACPPRDSPADAAARREVARVITRYLDAYRRNDPAALADLYAPDGILMPPGRPLIRGRDSIREFWEQGMEAGFQMENLEIGGSASTGYAVGRYFIPPDDENDAESGKYIITVKRQPGGAWLVAADIWNEDDDGSDEDTQPDSAARTVATLQAALRHVDRPAPLRPAPLRPASP